MVALFAVLVVVVVVAVVRLAVWLFEGKGKGGEESDNSGRREERKIRDDEQFKYTHRE